MSPKNLKSISLFIPPFVVALAIATTGCERATNATPANSPVASAPSTMEPKATPTPEKTVAMKSSEFQKSANATSKVDMGRVKAAVYFDPQKWKLEKPEAGGRMELMHQDGEAFAMVISERLQLNLNNLRSIVLSNAKQAAPDAKIVGQEKRIVNGREVLFMRLRGTIEGIPFTYMGYYFTGKEGTIQVITYTSENLLSEYQQDFEELLNGLTLKS